VSVDVLTEIKEALLVRWSGFTDGCGGVVAYAIRVLQAGSMLPLWTHLSNSSTNTSVEVPVKESVAWTGQLTASVYAISVSGQISRTASVQFSVYNPSLIHGAVVIRQSGMQHISLELGEPPSVEAEGGRDD
jgi:hypothetical protein